MTKRGENKESPRYLVQQTEAEADIDEILGDLVEIIISGLSASPGEKATNPVTIEETQGNRDSFQAGLPFANVPYSNSDVQ